MAASFVLRGIASAAISRLTDGLISYAMGKIRMRNELKDEMARLEKVLPKIQVVVNAVDQGLIRDENPGFEKWLWQLRDAVDMANDAMDELAYNDAKQKVDALKAEENELHFDKTASDFQTHIEKKRIMEVGTSKVKGAASSFKSLFKDSFNEDPILKSLKNALKALDEVAADVGEFYILVQNMEHKQQEKRKSIIVSRESGSILNVQTRVFGREGEKEEIVSKLLDPDFKSMKSNFGILPIIGIGGIGKTTLAQFVYNDQRVVDHFGLRMWVCISNPFDVVMVTKKLYESAFGANANFDNFGLVQEKLNEKLKFKKFLIVFDDAWNDNDKLGWEKLLAPLQSGDKGSMILLTTRMESVTRTIGLTMMDPIFLKGMNEVEYWNLFLESAFGDRNHIYHKKLQDIGKEIVKKLGGSPLAAKTVGRMLCSRLDEEQWENVFQSEIWSSDHEQYGIMPALRLSYQHLDLHLKPCFSFCSLFPQDHIFIKEDLIDMWMAVGFLVPRVGDENRRPEDIGSEYFDELVNKSLLEGRPWEGYLKNKNQKFNYYVMHDLLHDLATFVSRGECFRYIGGKTTSIPPTVRHLRAHITDPSEFNLSGVKHLHTLILQLDRNSHAERNNINGLINRWIKELQNLRILWLSSLDLCEFPHDVNDLIHLRYLYLRGWCHPKINIKLYFLQVFELNSYFDQLDIQHCINSIKRLINLRKVSMEFRLFNFRFGPLKVGMLTSLQNRVIEPYELGNKEFGNKEGRRFINNVLDHLTPHSDLKTLWIADKIVGMRELSRMRELSTFQVVKTPPWMRELSTFQVVRLYLLGCTWEDLRYLEELPYLKYLYLGDMLDLKSVDHETGIFPSLEELCIHNMPELKKWSLVTKEQSEWMPCLRKLTLFDCPKMSCLPPLPSSLEILFIRTVGLVALPKIWQYPNSESHKLPQLAELTITDCDKLETWYFDQEIWLPCMRKVKIKQCPKLSISRASHENWQVRFKRIAPAILWPSNTSSLDEKMDASDVGTSRNPVSTPTGLVERTKIPSFSLYELEIEHPLLLSVVSLSNLTSIRKLTIPYYPKVKLEEYLLQNYEFLEELCLSRLSSRTSVPIDLMRFSKLRKLVLLDAASLESLPQLPPSLEELTIRRCTNKLMRSCSETGEYWPKLAHLRRVSVD